MYKAINKAFVISYLNHRYLSEEAHRLYDTRGVIAIDQNMIESNILPKPLIINRELINDPCFKMNAERYLKRQYGAKANEMLENETISDIDFKMIESMCKLKSAYSAIRNKRVQAVMIAFKEDPNMSAIKPKKPKEVSTPLERTKKRKESKSDVVVCICKAIKMDGQACNARAKNGLYCVRHSKK